MALVLGFVRLPLGSKASDKGKVRRELVKVVKRMTD
jgi:hypothetical protein